MADKGLDPYDDYDFLFDFVFSLLSCSIENLSLFCSIVEIILGYRSATYC